MESSYGSFGFPSASRTPGDVAATIYERLGIDPEATVYDRQRRPHPVLPQGRVVGGMI
jgi:hypothetical protein